jgi:N-dimethylarginine dimethylaminohydrolase
VNLLDVLGDAGFRTVIPVPAADQLIYGCNSLLIAPNDIVLVKRQEGVSAEFKAALKQARVNFTEADLTNLSMGYGASHCVTNVARQG